MTSASTDAVESGRQRLKGVPCAAVPRLCVFLYITANHSQTDAEKQGRERKTNRRPVKVGPTLCPQALVKTSTGHRLLQRRRNHAHPTSVVPSGAPQIRLNIVGENPGSAQDWP
jgi:hypothetical protein